MGSKEFLHEFSSNGCLSGLANVMLRRLHRLQLFDLHIEASLLTQMTVLTLTNMVDCRKLPFSAMSGSLVCSWDYSCNSGFGGRGINPFIPAVPTPLLRIIIFLRIGNGHERHTKNN